MKRLFTLLFAAMLAGQVWAEDFTVGDLKYTITGANTVSVGAVNTDITGNIDIPAEIENEGVTYSVTAIGYRAFGGCKKIKSVTIPNSVTIIDQYAFQSCDGLTTTTISSSLVSIEMGAFQSTGLISITIPSSVTNISSYVFVGCKALTEINVDTDNTAYSSEDGVLFNKNKTELICFPTARTGSYTIPNSVKNIDFGAFYYSNLVSVTIANSVIGIGGYAFRHCDNLTSVIIPNSVKDMRQEVFDGCNNLTIFCEAESQPETWNDNWNNSNSPIVWGFDMDYSAFVYNVVVKANDNNYGSVQGTTAVVDETTVTIVAKPKSGCRFVKWSNGLKKLTENIAVKSDTTITAEFADGHFLRNGLHLITTSDSTVEVEKSVDYKNFTSVIIPDTIMVDGKIYSVTRIGTQAFYECENLASVTFSNRLKSIGYGAFADCYALQTVILPDGLTDIDRFAFSSFGEQKHLVIVPSSVTSIGSMAFQNVQNVVYSGNATNSPWGAKNVYAAKDENGFFYSDAEKTQIAKYIGNGGNLIIPEGVKSIDSKVFENCGNLTSVTLPSTLENINKNTFSNCSNLTSVVLKEGVKSIGEKAFFGCSKLSSITIPNSVTDIDKYAFWECGGLESVTIGNGVTRIGGGAFDQCSKLTSITIPDAVKRIEADAFNGCSSLKSVIIGNSVDSILNWAFNGCTSLTTLKISKSVKSIGDDAFRGCTSLKTVDIPDGVEHIGNSAFRDCSNLKLVTIANSVKTIDKWAFESVYVVVYPGSATGKPWDANYVYSAIDENGFLYDDVEKTKLAKYIGDNQDISIPEGVKIINDHAFSYSQLKSVTFPNSVESIGVYAFYNCTGLTSLVIPNGVTNIGAGAFYECSGITSLTISGPVKTIDEGAFEGCDNIKELICNSNGIGQQFKKDTVLETLIIGDSVTIIPDEAFENCSGLTSVTLGKSLTTIGAYAFYYCDKLTSITIPSSVKEIGIWAFAGCDNLKTLTCNTNAVGSHFSGKSSIETVVIGDSVTSIPDNAFYGCRGLKSVTIPNSVESIGEYAFNNCGLNSINIPSSVTSIGKLAFRGGPLYVYYLGGKAEEGSPWGANRVYKALDENGFLYYDTEKTQLAGYNGNKHDIIIPNSVKTISAEAFSGDTVITSVVIGDSVTAIEKYAFKDCSALTSVTIPSSVKSIDEKAFEGCSAIKQLTYNTDAVGIQFYENPLLETVVIGDSVTKIRNGTFYKCTGLKSVTIGKSVKNIGGSAFRECSSLTSITLPDSVESIGDYYTFWGCEALTTINIPNTVTSIGVSAFTGCSSLTSISIPEGVTTIERSAFTGCTSLKSLTLPHSLKEIVADAFSGCRIETLMFNTDAFGYRFLEDSVLKTVIIGDSTTIDGCSFQRCKNLETVIVPSSINYSIYTLFWGCNNIQYNEYDNALYLGNDENPYLVLVKAKSRDISSVEISGRCRVIDNYAFSGCRSLTSITIPDSVVYIGEGAFNNCSGLASVVIPESVSKISFDVFEDCNNATVYCQADTLPSGWLGTNWNRSNRPVKWNCKRITVTVNDTTLGDVTYSVAGGIGANGSIWFPYGTTLKLSASNNKYHVKWDDNTYSRTITVTNDTSYSVTLEPHTIVTDAAVAPTETTDGLTEGSHCSVCGEIIVKQNVIPSLGEVAFFTYNIIDGTSVEITGYTGSRTDISIPSEIVDNGTTYTVTHIAREAFNKNGNLTSVVIPNSVTYIGDKAFEDCGNLQSVVMPESVTRIGDNAFCNCSNLSTITIPDGITTINAGAFGNCSSLTSINIPSSVTFIGNSAFSGSGLTSIDLPDSVTTIRSFAFQNCKGLGTIVIPKSVTTIDNWVFKGCDNLTIYCEAISMPYSWGTNWNSDNRPVVWGYGATLFNVNVMANNAGYGSVSGGGTVPNGSKITITANPASGYRFEKWSNGLTTATATITVTSDTTLVAEFVSAQTSVGNLHYEITSSTTVKVVKSDGYQTMTEVVIPETIEISGKTYSVTTIGEEAFRGCNNLSSVTIPNSVKTIENWAFYRCYGLKSITIPNSVERILYGAFENCSGLESVTISEGVTTFGSCVFENCDGLTSISIPESVTSIPYGMFEYCDNLTTISLPNTIVKVDNSAFEGCNKLEYNEFDNALYLGNAENPYVVLIKVKSTDITSCEINSNCKVISGAAFNNCKDLTSFTVPNSVEYIGYGAFSGCSSLESITLPFVGDKRHSFTDAEQYPFGYIFGGSSYEGGVATTQSYYYYDDGGYVNSTYYIPSSLKSVVLTDCDYIQYDAFDDCDNLTSITIPTSVTQIEASAFNGRRDNLTIYCDLKSAPRGWDLYLDSYNIVWGTTDVVDANNVDGDFAYRIIDGTKAEIIDYVGSDSVIVIPSVITKNGIQYTVTRIGDNAFKSYREMQSVTIPNTVTSIGNRSFAKCYRLKSVDIPNSVTTIGSYAFEDCGGLTSVELPNSVTTFGKGAFHYCYNLTSVEIPNSVTNISNNMFSYCSGLTSVTIPNSVSSIGSNAFASCKSLTSVTIPNSVTYIGEWAFHNSGLTYIAIPNSVTSIDGWAFDSCDSLAVVTIPNSVTTMDWLVFQDCPNTTIYCEPASKPDGWSDYWNPDSCFVVWGFDINQIFNVVVTANNNEYGSVMGGGAFIGRSTFEISATPTTGYHFTSWNDGNIDNPRTLTIASDASLTALFEAHTVVTDLAVKATCTEPGLTEGSHCLVCGEVLVAQKEFPALGHKFVNYIYNNDATTEANGTETAVCERGCGATDTRVAEGTKLNTAIAESTANAVNIYAYDNKIVVENATEEIRVYNAMGALVGCIGKDASGRVSTGETTITINTSGVYIVKTGATVKRVVVN